MPKIPTKDSAGNPNGFILPVWNALDNPELRPEQVYVTAIAPRSRKGPHLHRVRRGLFKVIVGQIELRDRGGFGQPPDGYWSHLLNPDVEPFFIRPGVPCALYNYGDTEALVLNMPSPAWGAEQQDDWPVNDWLDPEDWPPTMPVERTARLQAMYASYTDEELQGRIDCEEEHIAGGYDPNTLDLKKRGMNPQTAASIIQEIRDELLRRKTDGR